MPKISKHTATQGHDYGPVADHYDEIAGYRIAFTTFREPVDSTPLLKGLPDDRCQCPHWGYVITGRMTFRYCDHDEVYEAGDAFYAPPGHIPMEHAPGTEIVMFSPADELLEAEAATARNIQALQAG
jgi:hypothetical protein